MTSPSPALQGAMAFPSWALRGAMAFPSWALRGAMAGSLLLASPAQALARASEGPPTPPPPGTWQARDLALVRWVNRDLASPWLDPPMVAVSWLPTLAVPTLVALGAGLAGDPAGIRAGLTSGGADLLGLAASEGLKQLVGRPRPFMLDPELRLPAGKTPGTSFPSGHATFAFASATALSRAYPAAAPWLFGEACLVGFSRVYLGQHHPSDVLAGAALGIGVGALALWGADRLSPGGGQVGGGQGVPVP